MKKYILLFVASFFSITTAFGYCTNNAVYTQITLDSKRASLQIADHNAHSAAGRSNSVIENQLTAMRAEISQLESQLQTDNNEYQACLVFDQGFDAYERGEYENSVNYYKQLIQNYPSDINSGTARSNLVLGLNKLLSIAYDKKDWQGTLSYGNQVLSYDPANVNALWNMGAAYWNLDDLSNAQSHYQRAYDNAKTSDDIKKLRGYLDDIKKEMEQKEAKKNAPSNDPLSHLQYYLKTLNVPTAWSKVTNSNLVTVAVIDDGININHPDLTSKIWVRTNAVYGASKVIDFVGDKIGSNLPTGEHGTMIAGIIGAITNNNEGIAGIAKNVKFMPLRVFDFDDNASDDSIIRAINFAIDNGANIINLSLGGNQFAEYSKDYDSIIKRAYDKGIVVVIAAGNGDILSKQQTGIDLSVNPISPVCNNEGNTEYSTGVEAYTIDAYRTWWTNYNGCTAFSAPGDGIVSTSIPVFNKEYGTNYNMADGTSFSAPMVTGIIALGFNQYGFVSPKIVRESLNASLVKDSTSGNYQIDAAKYLDALGKRSAEITKQQKNYNSKIRTQNSIDSNSDGDTLAEFGIVTKQDSEEGYNLNSNVLRQEVVGMAMKLGKFELLEDYKCKKVFQDVSSTKPNNWICRAVEIGAEHGIVSNLNKSFNPESSITRAEALAILLKAAGIKVESSSVSKILDVTEGWQINVVNSALSNGFIDLADNFYPNKSATRGEIFNMAKRILKYKS